jgi:hypothetical protein
MNEQSVKPKRRRRKCNRCGKFGDPRDPKNPMVVTPSGRVYYSEAHFSHKSCLDKERGL